MKNYFRFTLFLFPLWIYSQNLQKEKDYYNWFDQMVGRDHTDLYNGKQYFDKDKSVRFDDRHAYFKSDKFLKGSVIYDNQTYYNLDLQYNLEIDELIVNLKSQEIVSVFKLIKDKISEFTIEQHRFIRKDNVQEMEGFYEVLLEDTSYSLLKKHKKSRRKKVKHLERIRHLFYYFIGSESYGILIGSTYHQLTSKSDVINLFPELRKEISNFYYDRWSLKKSQPDAFMKSLFEQVINPSLSKKGS